MQHYVAKEVVCPFYRREDTAVNKIFCEGFCTTCSIQLTFKGKAQLTTHKETHCNSFEGYKRCPLYPVINKQYEVT